MSYLEHQFCRVISGGENQTMQSLGYGPGDIGYRKPKMEGSQGTLWWIKGQGYDLTEGEFEIISVDELPSSWHVWLIEDTYGHTRETIQSFVDIYQEVMPFVENWSSVRDFRMVKDKFSADQIRRMAEAIIGEQIAYHVVLLYKNGSFKDTMIKNSPKTISHYDETFIDVNFGTGLPCEDSSKYFSLTELKDSRGCPVYLECQ